MFLSEQARNDLYIGNLYYGENTSIFRLQIASNNCVLPQFWLSQIWLPQISPNNYLEPEFLKVIKEMSFFRKDRGGYPATYVRLQAFLKQHMKSSQKNIVILGAQLERLTRFSEHCCSALPRKWSFSDLLRLDTWNHKSLLTILANFISH